MDYDALIVGARVAGASLALLLGQQGYRVLMVDRDRFPSDTLSTHFMGPPAVALLGQLGVLADVEAVGFRRITRSRTYIDDCIFEGPHAPAGGYGLAPRRDCLDALLIQHAMTRGGVEFWERARVDSLIVDEGRVAGALVRSADGETHEVRARIVVGADGKYSKVAEWVGAATYHETPPLRPGYYGYYRGLAPLPEPAVELFFTGDHVGFVFPMQPGLDCIALEVQPDDFAVFRADPSAALEARIRALPTMAMRMEGARLEGAVQGTRGIANYLRVPYGPGWALTGDAAYLKDPITGFGIGDAFQQAFWLAEALDAVFKGAAWDDSLGAFHHRRDEALRPLYEFTLWFTQMRDAPPASVAWIRAVLAVPPYARALAAGLPAVLQEAIPPHLWPGIQQLAQAFGASDDGGA